MLEEGDSRILIDPSGEEADNLDKFGKLNAVLYTHEHGDHFDADLAQKFADGGAAIYANASTAKKMKSQPNVVKGGQKFKAGNFDVKVIGLPHCPMPDGSKGPPNVGYLVNRKLFDPGDGKELGGLKVGNLAVPITGPDISMRDAFDFIQQVEAKIAIPIHYDKLGANADVYKVFAGYFDFPFELKPLKHGESLEI